MKAMFNQFHRAQIAASSAMALALSALGCAAQINRARVVDLSASRLQPTLQLALSVPSELVSTTDQSLTLALSRKAATPPKSVGPTVTGILKVNVSASMPVEGLTN